MGFFEKAIDYCKANPVMAILIAGLVLFCLVLVIIAIVLSSKAKKRRKALQKEAVAKVKAAAEEEKLAKAAEEAAAKAKAEAKAEAEAAAAEKNSAPLPPKYCMFCGKKNAGEAEFCEECAGKEFGDLESYLARKEEKEKARAQAEKSEAAQKEEAMLSEAIAKADEKAAPKKKATKKSNTSESKIYEENETDKQAKYTGKWVIFRMYTVGTEDEESEETYFFELRASNGEKLLSSEEYNSYNGALRGISTHKANIARDNFRIALSKKGDYIYKLMSGKNTLLCTGENYPTKARCESAIESVKRFAQTAVLDENVEEHLVKMPVEDDSSVPALPEGYNGKWVISCETNENGEKSYSFTLYANNGEKLLSSEEYTSYIGAVNGIATHKSNISRGNFRITLTKRGDYIYKLLNGNGQLLCLGEHYKTKRLCQNAVESVKRFALNSPTLTDASIEK